MSTKIGFISPKVYLAAKIIVGVWALGSLAAFVIFWGSAALGTEQPAVFQVKYDGLGTLGANAPVVFVLQAILQVLLLIAQWHAWQSLGRLENPASDYSDLVRHLARFATALFFYAIGASILAIVRASLAAAAEAPGDLTVVFAIDADRMTLLIVSFVLYCVCNALRLADEAVEETQSFL